MDEPELSGSASLPPGAMCALHPDAAASSTCARCGNYACSDCNLGGGAALCPPCRERTGGISGFALTRDNWTLDGVFSYGFERYKADQNWLPLGIVTLIFIAVIYGVALAGSLFQMFLVGEPAVILAVVSQVAQVVLQMWLQLGFFAVVLETARGGKPEVAMLFSLGGRLPAALLQLFVIYLVMLAILGPGVVLLFLGVADGGFGGLAIGGLVWLVLVGVPLAYCGLGVSFAQLFLVAEPRMTAIEGLRASWRLASGQRWPLLGTLLLTGLLGMAGVLACCIGALASLPLASLVFTAVFLALRNQPLAQQVPSS